MSVSSIAVDFRGHTSFARDDEVALFRKLADAIVNGSTAVFVDETHGATKCNVRFDLTDGTQTRCEIADLLIIARSDRPPFLRATFWQAKKVKVSNWVAHGTQDRHIDFPAQFNQWDLLSRRPTIQGVRPFDPPADLLESFQSASIGSFGVFYERNAQIEVAHSVAEFLSCSNPKASAPTFLANAYLEPYCMHDEVVVRSELEPFLAALFDHQIGAALSDSTLQHQWLVNYAKAKAASGGQSQQLPADFFDGFNVNQVLDSMPDRDGLSLLLVDTPLS
ncbi:hypothetical protein [Ralstonia syzygii]|uniref:Uncharacterized protein n=1 Tax=Ralstonia syzygii R24 TaxID=907261 RepID=G3AC50_9RALS|nr:hypothetical protein [Ralstonia syzygii]CCA87124.1 hypothetical protein RALSY_mp30443 [Ralstonia syzygii R24]